MAIRNTSDWRKASSSFQKELVLNGAKFTKEGELLMLKASEDFIQSAESRPHTMVPFYTGNLMDSIGVRLLNGNRLVGYRTMTEVTSQHAVKPQHMKGYKGDIWGDVELMQRISRPSRRTGTGLVAQMMVGVPYATNVGGGGDEEDEFSPTYLNELSKLFSWRIETYLKLLEKYPSAKTVGVTQRFGMF